MMKIDWQKWAAVIFCIIAAVAVLWLIIKYLLGIFLPFLIAWGVAILVAPAAGWVSKKTKIPIKFISAVLLTVVLGILITIIALLADRLIFELKRLVDWLVSGEGNLSENIAKFAGELLNLGDKIPILRDMRGIEEFEAFLDGIDDMIIKLLTDLITNISTWVPSALIKFASKLPSFLLMLTVTIIACFYFCFDLKSINTSLLSLLPKRAADRMPVLKTRVFSAAGKWLRAYLILFGITFAELFLGFTILGIEYPLLIALIGALVDILPVFGTGTILVPWGLYELITKNFKLGFGLLILYGVTVIVRQIAEPHVVGGSLGIHPLLALVAMYTGFRLFGILGMILLPAILMLIKNVIVSDDTIKNKNIKNKYNETKSLK